MSNAQGGTSHIAYLQKIRDGVVFSEGFENDNFITADGWTVLQGTPANASNQYKQGIKSWDNSSNSQSLPVAKKVITDHNVDSDWIVIGWFYDDVSHVTEQGPYLKLKGSNGSFVSVGVRNSVSSVNYSYAALSGATDAPTTNSGIPRTTGWHQFMILPQGTRMNILIDGAVALNQLVALPTSISEIYLNSNTVGGTGNSFGFFDEILFSRSNIFSFNFPSNITSAQTLDSFNIPIPAQVNQATNLNNKDFPFGLFLEAGQGTRLLFRSSLFYINPGDIYEFSDIDFGRKFTSMQTIDTALANQNKTANGKREVINFGIQDQHSFTMEQLEGVSWRQKADNFFYYARGGGPFSIMVDDINDVALGVIASFRQAGTTKKVIIMPNLSTNPTDAFTVGNTYTLQQNFNTDKEVVTLASKDTNSLTFNEDLNFDVNQGDYVYSQFLFPFQELPQQNLGGFSQVNAQNIRYTWTLPSQDYIEG